MRFHFLVLLLCTLYGLFFTLGKTALQYSQPFFFTGIRMGIAGILLFVYMYIFHRKLIKIKKQHLLPLFWVGITGVYLTNAYEFWGLQYLKAGKACFIYSLSPIFTAFISYFYFHEKISLKQIIGISISIFGFIPLLVIPAEHEDISGSIGVLSYAELALMFSAMTTSVGWVLMRSLVNKHHLNPVVANSISMMIGGVAATIHSLFVEVWDPFPVYNYQQFTIWLFATILNSNIIAYNLHAFLFRRYTATYLDLATLSATFFAALFGWLFLEEVLSWVFWTCLLGVVSGLFLYFQGEKKAITSRLMR